MHPFRIAICETVPQFNEGMGFKGIRTVEVAEFENTRNDVKKCFNHCEKRRKICQTNLMYQPGHLRTKVTAATDFTDEPIIQCYMRVTENTFVDDWGKK